MSAEEKKKFVIKRTFINVKNLGERRWLYGEEKMHFVPWRIYIEKCHSSCCFNIFLQCLQLSDGKEWSIDTTIKTKILIDGDKRVFEKQRRFSDSSERSEMLRTEKLNDILDEGNLTVECHVAINKMIGIEKPFDSCFNDDSAKEFSDVVLKVKNQKLYVFRMYLARHSSYFKSLFLGNFTESKKSEVELKGIDSYDFQKFLEVIYGEPDINDETVDGILRLADMYDAKAPIKQCEKFLVNDSKKSLKEKFILATQYNLENLKKKCMPEFRTFDDIDAVIPEDPSQLDCSVWRELLKLSIQFSKKL